MVKQSLMVVEISPSALFLRDKTIKHLIISYFLKPKSRNGIRSMRTIESYKIKSYPSNIQVVVYYSDGDTTITDYSTDYCNCVGEYTKDEWIEGLREKYREWNDDIYNEIVDRMSILFNDEFFSKDQD